MIVVAVVQACLSEGFCQDIFCVQQLAASTGYQYVRLVVDGSRSCLPAQSKLLLHLGCAAGGHRKILALGAESGRESGGYRNVDSRGESVGAWCAAGWRCSRWRVLGAL